MTEPMSLFDEFAGHPEPSRGSLVIDLDLAGQAAAGARPNSVAAQQRAAHIINLRDDADLSGEQSIRSTDTGAEAPENTVDDAAEEGSDDRLGRADYIAALRGPAGIWLAKGILHHKIPVPKDSSQDPTRTS